VKPGGAGADAGLQPGVVILQVDGAAVSSTAALKKMLADAKKSGKEAVLLRLQVGEAKQFRALTIGKK
jgi:serine protease Do